MKLILKEYRIVYNILLHLLSWAAILSIIYFLQHSTDDPRRFRGLDNWIQWNLFLIVAVLAFLFYLNSYLLIPRFLFRKRIFLYICINFFLLFGFVQGMNRDFRYILRKVQVYMLKEHPDLAADFPPRPIANDPRPTLPYAITLLPFLMTVTSSIAFRYIASSLENENKNKEERMATLTSELQFLKSQVSPHFLFNILNNLTYLARKQSMILEPALIKLSSLLRYMLYDTDAEKVLLEKEIKYLEDYIELQEIRHHDLRINTSFNSEREGLMIAPMLLIPFVENAFKHAVSFVDDHSFIRIDLITKDRELYFKVENKFALTEVEQKDKSSGIGLANVKKRLQLIYPQLHQLTIERHYNVFCVNLKINL